MGFGQKRVNWVNWCITTTSFSVLVNGSLEGFLKSIGGLKQGDPLSLCLFVLGMEVFSLLVDRIAFEGFLFGYKIVNKNGDEVKITHLLFVDDTLVFCEDSREQMVYLSWILLWFEAILDMKINPEKSYVLVGGSMEDLEGLVLELGCRHLWVCVAIQTLLGMGLKRGSRKN